ncbi:MAG: hypothetical protein FWH17_06430 [Oscillospiraceae bacterium]|nr:hypothetical protein [Oscillospiraceae bacterium]
MKKIKQSSENEMIYEFLKMEFSSDRYFEKILSALRELNIDKSVITNGNIESEQENVLRAKILKQFRGYRDREIFERFPSKINWFWTVFDKEDITKIFYIEYSYWNELSNYTGSPLEAAKTILSGKTIYDVPNDNLIRGAEKIKAGHKFPPLIFLTDENQSRYNILEGHGRMTAYALIPDLFNDVSVLLGVCDANELNKWYGEMPA